MTNKHQRTGRLMRALALFAFLPAAAFAQPQRHALLIGGLGGEPAYTEQFRQHLFSARQALLDLGVPQPNVVVLAEPAVADQDFVDDASTAENVQAAFGRLAERAGAEDEVFVLLFGHGSSSSQGAALNIPRRDLTAADYAELVAAVPGRVVFVNTASASGPFVEALSAPERVVITAAHTGTRRTGTVFPQYFVEALASPAADLDRDGALSVMETFRYAAEAVARHFDVEGTIATEQALLDDDGDGQGTALDELDGALDGAVAATTFLRRGDALAADASPADVQQRDGLLRQIEEVKRRKGDLGEDAYYAELERLFVDLAQLNARLEAGR